MAGVTNLNHVDDVNNLDNFSVTNNVDGNGLHRPVAILNVRTIEVFS
jgi:hypothetical protein